MKIVPNILRAALYVAMFFLLIGGARRADAQAPSSTLPVVFFSDFHFDPLRDPAKVPLLERSPLAQWPAILNKPASADQQARFAAVQDACNGKEGVDSSWELFRTSLVAAAAQKPAARFVTVSGDLLVHDIDCRYRASMGMPPASTDDQSVSAAFAEKTTVFVMMEVEAAFPHIPVYLALGNNDSRCNHNRMDWHDEYLKASTDAVLSGLRGISPGERSAAARSYASAGYYAVTLPAPMENTRLLVINDIYMMPKFANCKADSKDSRGEQEQTAWLANELDAARSGHQHVWLLGHLPPVVNPDATLSARGDYCKTGNTIRFQTTDDLANLVTAHADTITLGIFGHTHMDEIHLLAGPGGAVPIKNIAAVTPIAGSMPSFTVGRIDPASATLADYSVYQASNTGDAATHWTREYAFNDTYAESGFNAASLHDLISRLRADRTETGKDSQSYRLHFLKGSEGKKLGPSWPGYVCSMDSATGKTFKDCVCGLK